MMNKMLTVDTKRKIDSARDILVGKIPDPKAQVEQITTALIYKFMDDMDQEALEIGGKARYFTGDFEKYSWHKVMDTKLGAQERMNLYAEAIGKFQTNPNLPSLFRDIFKDSFLPFRNPETLTLFLRQINEFTYDHSENLGDAYEYLLSIMGSQGDAGQFRTPRHIIEFIVKVVDPKKEDTVLDPACGTSGFLISAYKHILAQHDGKDDDTGEPIKSEKRLTPQDRSQITKNFVGYDISPDMVRISEVNMFLHDFTEPKIFEYDTLSSEDKWDDRFDVILANPPFMSPKGGIRPHKRFSIQANRSEVLFVDYIMEHLKPKGRAGIIVPEGIIFQSSNAYVELRKKLIEDGLFCVISLPSGVFQPYSGVKTSILLFDNEISKKSDNILFVKVSNDGYELGAQRKPTPDNDDLPNVIKLINAFKNNPAVSEDKVYEEAGLNQPATWGNAVWDQSEWAGGEEIKIVSRKEIAETGDYNLTGSRYSSSERGAEVTGKWPMKSLGELFEMQNGKAFKKSEWDNAGIPIIRIANLNSNLAEYNYFKGKYDQKIEINKGDLLFSWSGTVGTSFGPHYWIRGKGLLNQHIFKLNPQKNNVDKKFAYYVLKSLIPKIEQKAHGAGGLVHITKAELVKFEIPLPPIEVQKQIVEELDGYQRIIDGANQVVDSWKPKIEVNPDWKICKLEEIAEVTSSKRIFKDEYVEKGIPFYRTKEVVELYQSKQISLELYISEKRFNEIKDEFDIPKKGDILISAVGTIGYSWVVPDVCKKIVTIQN